ncbi:Peroxisomal membrane protein PEX17 [Cyphellophora attinorum]|uniref:Peroxisomal membrane protein PEX17 n=1 Tax=Cyphellophora attinorum TaxID=1664694 RepID=A0A0N1P0C3_9EURO|nr:Peroxisomal membrane protein PEX17 [Phialophora attinorum]KPI40052.1 Peroxisomal membrane protein PEX17 [Phialophora attinorum]
MDRSLAALLRSLQVSSSPKDAHRLLPSATSLLSRLSNPLNITLLSSQILEHNVLWPQPVRLVDVRQLFSVFYTATLRFREDKRRELTPEEVFANSQQQNLAPSQLSESRWIKAVIKGASGESSPRWRHAVMIGAILLAGTSHGEEPIAAGLRPKLETALVTASNLALQRPDDLDGHLAVAFVLNNTFQLLSDGNTMLLDADALLPVLTHVTFFSQEGLEYGYWLTAIDQDVVATVDGKSAWSARSTSFARVQEIKSRPFVSGLGGISRLMAYAIDHAHKYTRVIETVARLADFARVVSASWRQNKLSEVDISEEAQILSQETTRKTLPALLQIFRDMMFTVIIALRSVLGRLLTDPSFATDTSAPGIAILCLDILRDTYFISHRFGQTSSSQYTFVSFTALDVLNRYPRTVENFLRTNIPKHAGAIPRHPLERNLDLFFLNTSENLTLTASASMNDELLVMALPYIEAQGDPRLGELYEAGHSLVLAIFAAPQNADLLVKHTPHYIETLMRSFPHSLNPRQFRLAIRSVVKLASPPSTVATLMPHLQPIILDLLSQRLINASEAVLPAMSDLPVESQQPLSEKAVLMLAMLESLPFLPVPALREWLDTAADLVHKIQHPAQRALCQQRFWEILSNGDMDVDRAATSVTWWNNSGGRELVTLGQLPEDDEYTMSGALVQDSKL